MNETEELRSYSFTRYRQGRAALPQEMAQGVEVHAPSLEAAITKAVKIAKGMGTDCIVYDGAREALSGGGESGDETGWLAELRGNVPKYWETDAGSSDGDGWTADAAKALRFARKIDVENFIADIGWTDVTAVEHMWVAPRHNEIAPKHIGPFVLDHAEVPSGEHCHPNSPHCSKLVYIAKGTKHD